MKKRISIFVVLSMVLCISLSGCTQNISKQDVSQNSEQTSTQTEASQPDVSSTSSPDSLPGFNSDTGDRTIMDESNNLDDIGVSSGGELIQSNVDNYHPKQDSDGMYVFNVQGHEIRLKTNIWNYIGDAKIGGETVHNYFSLEVIAEKLGYDRKESADGVYRHDNDDGSYIFAGFQHDGGSNTSQISSGRISSDNKTSYGVGPMIFEPYDFSKMDYYYYSTYPVSLDMIILCTYSMEYYADGNNGNCWENIFGETTPRIEP